MKKQYRIVYIAVEVKKREFTAKCLLSVILAHRGFTAVLCSKSDARRMASSGAPGILIDKDYTERRNAEWKKIKSNGGSVFAWDEEGIVEVLEHEFKLRTGFSSIKTADGIFLWGEAQRKLLEEMGVSKEKLHVAGNPRVDLLGHNRKYFYEKEVRSLIQKYGEYILVNLNYCKDDGTRSWADTVAAENNGILDDGTRKKLESTAQMYQKLLGIYCELIESLAGAVANKIILRPHPGEMAMDWWADRFQKFGNVEVNRAGDANLWIRGSKIMIHPGCTTAMEAYLSHDPSIFFNPLDEISVPFFSKLSLKADTIEETVKLVKRYLKKEIDPAVFFSKEKDKMLKEHIYLNSRKTACEQIADVIEKEKISSPYVRMGCRRKMRSSVRRLRAFMLHLIKKDRLGKYEYTSVREVKENVAAACRMMKYKNDFVINKADVNMFVIRKRYRNTGSSGYLQGSRE